MSSRYKDYYTPRKPSTTNPTLRRDLERLTSAELLWMASVLVDAPPEFTRLYQHYLRTGLSILEDRITALERRAAA